MKLRVVNPNEKGSIKKNVNNLNYIAIRDGVMLNVAKEVNNLNYIATRQGASLDDGCEHGLFGKINDMKEMGNIIDLEKAKNKIAKLTREGTVMYRFEPLISLKEQEALKLGLKTNTDWQELVKKSIPEIAKSLDIKIQDIEYACAIHQDKNHPHIHMVCWDKNQGVRDPFVHEKTSDELRKNINHMVYKDFLQEWYIEKSLSRDKMIELQKELIENIPRGEKEEILPNLKGFTKKMLDDYNKAFEEIKSKLPKSGSINYKTLKPALKKKLDAMVDQINDNKDFATEMNHYLYYTEKITEIDGKKQSKGRVKKAKADIYNRLGNIILKDIKVELKEERNIEFQAKREQWKKERYEQWQAEYQAMRIKISRSNAQHALLRLFSVLSSNRYLKQNSYNNYINKKSNLSNEAYHELYTKKSSISHMEWDKDINR